MFLHRPIFLGLVLLLGGVGRPVWGGIDTVPLPPPPAEHRIVGVPFFPQKKFGCGPASLASVLSHWGREVNLDSLTEEIYIPKLKGTLPIDMERAARARGLEARSYRGSLADLRVHISLGHPVIAFLNLGNRLFPNGHFVVVTGYDDRTEEVFAHSVTEPDTGIAYGRFAEGWAKTDFWTLLVIPKGPSPAP